MLAVDKVDVIQDIIERIEKEFTIQFTKDTAINESNQSLADRVDGVSDVLKFIKQFKTEVDALAEQEAKQWAEDEKKNNEEYANEQRRETSAERFTS